MKDARLNKYRRFELKMLHYKRRLNQLGMDEEQGNMYAFRYHGAPCSCGICKAEKWRDRDRKKEKLAILRVFNQFFD